MLKTHKFTDGETRKAIAEIARALQEIAQKVEQANMKLDHLIKTYRDDRYASERSRVDDLFGDDFPE